MDRNIMQDKLVKIGIISHFTGMKNQLVIQALNITTNKKPNKENHFVAEGIWINELIDLYNPVIKSLFICPEMITSEKAINLCLRLSKKAENVCFITEKVCMRMSAGKRDDGLIALCRLPNWNLDELILPQKSVVMVLDGLQIPGNVGTIIRSCDGADIDAVFICNRRTRITHPMIIRSSMCTLLNIPVLEVDHHQLAIWLLSKGFELWMADTDGAQRYDDAQFSDRTALIMGSEKYGIHKDWYSYQHKAVYVPMLGDVDSLNVGVAASIIAYEIKRKHGFNNS